MAWLKDHYFLCGWIALPFTLWNAISKLWGKQERTNANWTRSIIVLTFGITLGIATTPAFDMYARSFAQVLALASFYWIYFNKDR